jgi:hypothetical protein
MFSFNFEVLLPVTSPLIVELKQEIHTESHPAIGFTSQCLQFLYVCRGKLKFAVSFLLGSRQNPIFLMATRKLRQKVGLKKDFSLSLEAGSSQKMFSECGSWQRTILS